MLQRRPIVYFSHVVWQNHPSSSTPPLFPLEGSPKILMGDPLAETLLLQVDIYSNTLSMVMASLQRNEMNLSEGKWHEIKLNLCRVLQ